MGVAFGNRCAFRGEFLAARALCRIDYGLNCMRKCVYGIWIKKLRGVGVDLAMNRNIRRDHRTTTLHGLDS